MGISNSIYKHFGLPLTYAYATLRQSVASNLQFWGVIFCNLGTFKKFISNFITKRQILLPHIHPHVNMTTPTMFPVDKKQLGPKKVLFTNVFIPF